MATALILFLIACLLQSAQCGEFKVFMPQTINVLNGSCVTIPCSFDVQDRHRSHLDNTCKAMWKNEQDVVVFNSSNPQSPIKGNLIGDLTKKDCTTTLNNMKPEDGEKYYFRLECNNPLKYNFIEQNLEISVKDDPLTLTLTPSTLEVNDGNPVTLTCSAPVPCLSHPPTLTWTPGLGDIQETLQENQDKTKVKTSVLTFTASRLHHGQKISCNAVYNKQDGSTESVSTLTADVSCPECGEFKVFVPQTINVLSGSCVTIPCSFDVKDKFRSNLDETCKAKWKNEQDDVVFDSSNPQSTIKGNLTGDLTKKDCTTTLNNMKPEDSKKYYLRVECDNALKYNFKEQKLEISVKDHPPILTPSTLEVNDGNPVTLTCSAPAPCPSHPPTLTWTPGLGVIQETLQENHDKTKVKTSVLTFTASHLHHGQEISCNAVYNKQDGSTESVSRLTADVSYSPKNTTVSVSPSGPVPEDSTVTLTCSSTANPAVRDYTWYTAQGGQETVIGTGHVLQIQASKVRVPFFCKAENDLGAGRSTISQIDVQFAPQILSSSDCTQTTDQLNCSCETVGNPSPTLQWYLDRLPVNHSDKFAISKESLNDTGLRIIITVNQPQWRDLSTLLCRSSNSLGSVTERFHFYSLEPQKDSVMLIVFITTVVALLVLVCALFLVIRVQKIHHNGLKNTVAMSQLETTTTGEGNKVPNTEAEESIYANTNEPNSANLPNSEPNNEEGATKGSEKKNEESTNVIYSSVKLKTKSKKKRESTVDMDQPGSSYLEEERCMAEVTRKTTLNNALEMESLYDNMGPRNVNKEVECEYAQVTFKKKSDHK